MFCVVRVAKTTMQLRRICCDSVYDCQIAPLTRPNASLLNAPMICRDAGFKAAQVLFQKCCVRGRDGERRRRRRQQRARAPEVARRPCGGGAPRGLRSRTTCAAGGEPFVKVCGTAEQPERFIDAAAASIATGAGVGATAASSTAGQACLWPSADKSGISRERLRGDAPGEPRVLIFRSVCATSLHRSSTCAAFCSVCGAPLGRSATPRQKPHRNCGLRGAGARPLLARHFGGGGARGRTADRARAPARAQYVKRRGGMR